VLRLVSTQPLDCLRLVVGGTVKVAGEGLALYQQQSLVVKYVKKARSISNALRANENYNGSNRDDILSPRDETIAMTAHLMTQGLVETLGILRNFSADRKCRNKLSNCDVISRLCLMQEVYQGYPLVLLNCARVTAKLSLSDSFRAQINANSEHIRCLVKVVVNEAALCQAVMDGYGDTGDNDNRSSGSAVGGGGGAAAVVSEGKGGEDTPSGGSASGRDTGAGAGAGSALTQAGSWPSWYTWPLLSRICFTLGTLTTTNGDNRRLIASPVCGLLDNLLLLLQVSFYAVLCMYVCVTLKVLMFIFCLF
jgi:hypothetical protein